MKYIFYPIMTITILIVMLIIVVPFVFIWHLIWDFKVTPIREILTVDNEYLFDGISSFKDLLKDIFICKP